MALQAAYKQFLAAPNPSLLASNASLHYITTLVTVNGPAEIIKHLKSQSLDLKKLEENFLDLVEGPNSIAAEIHTTVEFLTGGGSYLPSLDDNFLADRRVTFPIIHIVTFDANGKIAQIRQNWDQGSLLKLIDVIGKTGRNWPIRDGKDQIKLIVNSVKSAGKAPVDAPQENGSTTARSRENSNNPTRDPHASLNLFAPREKNNGESLPGVVAPRASAKPPPRDYRELFAGESPAAGTEQAGAEEPLQTPSKRASIAPKIGAGSHYAPSRLFDNDENSPIRNDKETSPDRLIKTNPAKYQHFDFADGSDPQDAPKPSPLKDMKKSKHGSQWNFEDFNTPQKNVPSKVLRTNDVRHWGNENDEVLDSPIKPAKVDKPRRDAETHFEFQDDGTPDGQRRPAGRPRGAGHNSGLGLYQNNVYDEENGGPAGGDEPKVAGVIPNVKDRRKDFDPHFAMTDESPASSKVAPPPVDENRAKAVKMMDANWGSYDQSPSQKENVPVSSSNNRQNATKEPLSETTNAPSNVSTSITVAGDGMGSRKAPISNQGQNPRGINVGGDGMGGRKGAGRQWGFGDESDGEQEGGINKPSKYRTGKTAGKSQSTGGDFWDF